MKYGKRQHKYVPILFLKWLELPCEICLGCNCLNPNYTRTCSFRELIITLCSNFMAFSKNLYNVPYKTMSYIARAQNFSLLKKGRKWQGTEVVSYRNFSGSKWLGTDMSQDQNVARPKMSGTFCFRENRFFSNRFFILNRYNNNKIALFFNILYFFFKFSL